MDSTEMKTFENRKRRYIQLFAKIYEFEPTGGPLHIQLDDGNMDDHFVADDAIDWDDYIDGQIKYSGGLRWETHDITEEQAKALFAEILSVLQSMTEDQRMEAYHAGWDEARETNWWGKRAARH